MRAYLDKDKKQYQYCRYCGNDGHTYNHCAILKKHYLANNHLDYSDLEVSDHTQTLENSPFTLDPTGIKHSYFEKKPVSHFLFYRKNAHSYYGEKEEKPKKSKAKALCGFCGSAEHNRRKCDKMTEMVVILNDTNKAYREWFYDNFIAKGFGVGCMINYRTQQAKGHKDEIKIVSHFDPNHVSIGNLFSSWNSFYDRLEYKCVNSNWAETFGIYRETLEYWNHVEDQAKINMLLFRGYGIESIVAPCPTMPDKEWFMEQKPEFSWVVTKFDESTIASAYGKIIKTFHPKGVELYEKWKNLNYCY